MAAPGAKLVLMLCCLSLLTGLAGCGGDGESTTTTGAAKHRDSGGGSQQFFVKGGDNSVQEFGEEADASELQEAAIALHGFLDARASRDWSAACSYLAPAVAASLKQLGASSKQLQGAGCGELLEALSEEVPTSSLTAAAQADVGSLRREGDRAFVIYRGDGGAVYAIPMQREDGIWKLGGVSGTPLSGG